MITEFLMEGPEESFRLDKKTNPEVVKRQALWGGMQPGMRIVDLGCGPGRTTSLLSGLVQPHGEAIGIDYSPNRIEYAREHFSAPGLRFECRDARESLDDLGPFDFVWVRFLLEYYARGSVDIVKNASRILKPGGKLLLIDLDYNCLSHYGIPERLEKTICELMETLQREANFDPYAGRKLYSYLYDLGYEQITIDVMPHNLLYGKLNDRDSYNSLKKTEIMVKKGFINFEKYEGGYQEFMQELIGYYSHPRRFYYSPMICCVGLRPAHLVGVDG